MAQTEDQLKRAADLKLWIESRIAELQEEIDRLKEARTMTDAVLRASSFRPATEVSDTDTEAVAAPIPERREIRRDRGSEVIANAEIVGKNLIVEPVPGITLRTDTPPFKSFLIGKIFQGAKGKDEELVAKGKLKKGEEIRFSVQDKDGRIQKVTIENYGDRERLIEIINTVSWTFSRMLEKK